MPNIDKEKVLLYGTTLTSLIALFFSLNAQRRLAYVEYDTVDKHETAMQLIGQTAQRLNALESPGYRPYIEGGETNFE